MAISTAQTRESQSLAAELLALVTDPANTYPHLLERGRTFEVLFFSAVSGVYVAYVAAERLHLGDRLGFVMTALGAVALGAALGLLALAFISSVLAWSTNRAGGTAGLEEVSGVFGYATWPFLPLLAIVVPLEMIAYGPEVFSAARPAAAWPVSAIVTALEFATILLWLYLVLRGEAVSAHLSNAQAAKTMGKTVIRMAAIAVLFAIVSLVSFLI
ncbi:MAG: hypothetical protein ACRELX_03205 [Longimicrobiales bacterium]